MIITTKNSDGSIEYQDLEIQYSEEILIAAGFDENTDYNKLTNEQEKSI